MSVSDGSVPPVVRLLADPVRWRLMRELASGDWRVRELVAAAGQPQNLVSYHLRQLRAGGLVTARRSSFDGRDTYYSLDLDGCAGALAAAASTLHPGLAFLSAAAPERADGPGPGPRQADAAGPGSRQADTAGPTLRQADGPGSGPRLADGSDPAPRHADTNEPAPRHADTNGSGPRRVLFLCTGNSGRSPMAEALLRYRAGPRVQTASAGIRPKPLHPDAAAVMRDRYRIDITGHRPVSAEAVARERFDYVISLCDKARESRPEFAGRPRLVHWSLADPAAGEGGLTGYPAFERTAAELDARIRFLLPALDGTAGDAAQ